jgi:hypothetical protein
LVCCETLDEFREIKNTKQQKAEMERGVADALSKWVAEEGIKKID